MDVFHSFYFQRAEDRRKLLGEIYRIMKPAAFFSISVWPSPLDPGTEAEIKNADFYLGKEVSETLTYNNKNIGTRSVLNFRKAKYISALTN